ncbi:uncharacterized protein ACHE_21410S [Aspergillus chevalieri]|uniref:Uncharacterized protein n=1 Tax=Aspergillus chevalieri TaxID=182096 RepID=A0A7R7ZMA0_ASPCH|nr:uncharacterized protein ACHE_21410S [Aspergillus chevalieri]BCR85952.1 hypothetical protein ACHE_21410S [Aspergillus chevalieri]
MPSSKPVYYYKNKKGKIETISDTANTDERARRRNQLADIKTFLDQLNHYLLTPEDLMGCQRHERMSLEEDPKPLYFTPYEGPIEETENDVLLGYYAKCEPDDGHYTRAYCLVHAIES